MMRLLLKEDYQYKQIKDYVIITPVAVKPINDLLSAKSKSSMKEGLSSTVYDTITIEKIIIKYDTQTVQRKEVIYDTIKIRKQEIVYDTILSPESINVDAKKWHFGGFFGPILRKRNGDNLDADYYGVSVGGSAQYSLKNFYFQLDGSYQYLINTIKNSTITEITETRTDTISTFFVIEDGVRTPVYITEEVEVVREIQTDIDRTNSLQYLSFSLVAGYSFQLKNFSIGADLGVSTDWLLSRNELIFIGNELQEDNSIQYNDPVINAVVQLPLKFTRTNLIGTFSITPYFQYGINDDFRNPSPGGKRVVSGIKVGVLF